MSGMRSAWTFLFVTGLFLAACGKGEKTEDSASSKPKTSQATRPARTLPIPGTEAEPPTGAPPSGHPPVDAAHPTGAIVPPPPGSGTGEKGMTWKVPAGWVEETPSSSMRKAQYKVPGSAGDGECAVFYFGPGQGGDPMSNALRWAGQFKQPGGKPSDQVMKISNVNVGAIPVLVVEITGTYTGGMTATMKPAEDKPGSMLLGAIAQGPDANWFFKLTGPEATVNAQRTAFEEMIHSLRGGS